MKRSIHFPAMPTFFLIAAVAIVFLSIPERAVGADLTGKAQVIDGDTLRIDETEISLYGIDAPELKQTCKTRKGQIQHCGDLARQSLTNLVSRRNIACEVRATDPDGKRFAVCFVGPININENMVADGWAMADRLTGEDFVRAETFARARNEGLWRTEFTPPWDWRRLN